MPDQAPTRPLNSALPFIIFIILLIVFLPAAALAAPSISLSKKTGPPTSRILVSGKGFAPDVAVDVYFDTRDKRLVVTDNKGEFHNAAIQAPREAKPGEHWVSAVERNNGQAAQQPFVVETDWTEGLYDAGNSGFNSYENVLNSKSVINLGLRWIDAISGGTTPTVANGVVYFANSLGYVYALSARTGHILWKYQDARGSVFSPPAVVDGVVYFGGYSDVHALNAKTGKVIWDMAEAGGQGIFALTVADGMVYFSTGGGIAYALDAKSGSRLWSYYTGNYSTLSAPAIANDVVYIASGDLVALDARTGKLLWSFPIGNSGDIHSSPSVSNGVVYVGSQNGDIYAVDTVSTTLLWSYTTGGPIYFNLAVGDGVVYLPSFDGNLYAFDAYSGTVLWKYPTYLSLSPAIANGVVYVGVEVSGDQSILAALDASSGNLLWQYETSPYVWGPSIANGTVYLGAGGGSVYAFGLTHGKSDKALSERPNPKTLLPDLQLGNIVPGK